MIILLDSLIKMLYWMCEKSGGRPLTWPQFEHAVRRNFGGLESKDLNPFKEFKERINLISIPVDLTDVSKEVNKYNCNNAINGVNSATALLQLYL